MLKSFARKYRKRKSLTMKSTTRKKCLRRNILINISTHRIFHSENTLDFVMKREENLTDIINQVKEKLGLKTKQLPIIINERK